ncbi:MAG: Rrf2 family transcriptional regulator [Chitinophagaceae bacterium]|jgi:Rrf2 family protein|nr:Rrf2 family transcriptional regulator [Chitinophagaceae bacterium]OQY93681.1 MAG: transcriptional regulator [Sphingobacteriales bacterium UTBCD1]
MKISAQEEYGLRILLRIARSKEGDNMSIPVLSQLEGIGTAYVGKLAGVLRKNGFIISNPGNIGGYKLSKPPEEIFIGDVLKALGGAMFDKKFCGEFTGNSVLCANSVDCSVRSLWRIIQLSIDRVLQRITVADLVGSEKESQRILKSYLEPEVVS